MISLMRKDACLTPCGKHRLWLTRTWDATNPKLMVMCGLNPSIADAEIDDPTIRRDIGFARRESCGGLSKINLHTFRATDPDDMFSVNPIYRNAPQYRQAWTEQCNGADRVVVACWGADKRAGAMAKEFVAFAGEAGIPLWCLGLTKDGQPRHPLYLRSDAPLVRYMA